MHIVVNIRCYAMMYETNPVNGTGLCKDLNSLPLKESKIGDFNHIFDTVLKEGTFLNIIMENYTSFNFIVKIQKFFGLLSTTKHTIEKYVDAYRICNFEKIKMVVGLNMYHCKEGGYKNITNITFVMEQKIVLMITQMRNIAFVKHNIDKTI